MNEIPAPLFASVSEAAFASEEVRLTNTLANCPFCGGEGIGFEDSGFNGLGFVRCVTCWASGPEKDSKQAAHDAWNGRAAPA